jgi:hypothetical protein
MLALSALSTRKPQWTLEIPSPPKSSPAQKATHALLLMEGNSALPLPHHLLMLVSYVHRHHQNASHQTPAAQHQDITMQTKTKLI